MPSFVVVTVCGHKMVNLYLYFRVMMVHFRRSTTNYNQRCY